MDEKWVSVKELDKKFILLAFFFHRPLDSFVFSFLVTSFHYILILFSFDLLSFFYTYNLIFVLFQIMESQDLQITLAWKLSETHFQISLLFILWILLVTAGYFSLSFHFNILLHPDSYFKIFLFSPSHDCYKEEEKKINSRDGWILHCQLPLPHLLVLKFTSL